MTAIVIRNPNVMHGVPCFSGTRVAVRTLFEHLEAGYSIEVFLQEFPTVERQQVVGLLELLRDEAERTAALETA
jgi:uncharacterized protein (DUF433 family)